MNRAVKRYRIVKFSSPSGYDFYRVEKARPLFFLFGPQCWVNAGEVDSTGFCDTTSFSSLELARRYLREITTEEKIEVVEEVCIQ